MRKSVEVSLSDFLSNVKVEETLESKLLRDLPLNKPFTTKSITEFYKVTKNTVYPLLNKLESSGILTKSKGNFLDRNNVTIYQRIK
jgi:predicted transcriptional regulator